MIIAFLLAYIAFKEIYNAIERRKLLEMIMAKSLPEFKELEKKEKPQPSELKQPDLMPIDTVTDQQFTSAIKKELGTESHAEKVKGLLKRKLSGG